MTNSFDFLNQTIQYGQRERAQQTEYNLQRAEVIRAAWKNLETRLREELDVTDLTVQPWIPEEGDRLPVTGSLVRVQFPVLANVVGYVPEVILSIKTVISSRTGEVITAKPNNFYYSQNGRLLRSPDLHSALFNSLDLQESFPAPEMEDLCQTPLANHA